ncbi:transcriptional regulator [Bacillus sp. FJAT-27264]|uniref:helix-turn-helix transcriptional regulator n=1 Tax=Paenibacillus sp. (strain DSM 101736 / FJAT-27264) TaxID=1850362 RepID=UPI000807F41F|nr:helix-turn-helix transcriptional regulator [Bacillus sp. FJAT-27264]OBZ18242.1 transcriptional regulator [Bacillus sp. FJAT-27264]
MKKNLVKNNIRQLRFMKHEMTQQQLADRVGVTRQTIVAIEKEKYSPSLELAFLIAQVFELPLEDIFSFHPQGTDSSQVTSLEEEGK